MNFLTSSTKFNNLLHRFHLGMTKMCCRTIYEIRLGSHKGGNYNELTNDI